MKTKEEFNLSEKIGISDELCMFDDNDKLIKYLDVKDVKEFIRLLKEEMKDKSGSYSEVTRLEKIDKLAGEKLK